MRGWLIRAGGAIILALLLALGLRLAMRGVPAAGSAMAMAAYANADALAEFVLKGDGRGK